MIGWIGSAMSAFETYDQIAARMAETLKRQVRYSAILPEPYFEQLRKEKRNAAIHCFLQGVIYARYENRVAHSEARVRGLKRIVIGYVDDDIELTSDISEDDANLAITIKAMLLNGDLSDYHKDHRASHPGLEAKYGKSSEAEKESKAD